MPYGAGSLLGLAVGATADKALGDDEDISLGAGIGGVIGMGPNAAATYAGKAMRNFSEGAYNKSPLDARSPVESFIQKHGGSGVAQENMALSVYRNLRGTIKGEQYTDLQTVLDKEYGGFVTEGMRGGRDAKAEFVKYKKLYPNANPEELRLKVLRDSSEAIYKPLDNRVKELESLIKAEKNPNTRLALTEERKKLIRSRPRHGELDRKYRHEIAKNEVQSMAWDKKWDVQRLRRSGYDYMGVYKWRDLKNFIGDPSVIKAWENDFNKFSKWNTFLPDKKNIPVIINTHRGDRMIQQRLFRQSHDWGNRISHRIANGQIKGTEELYNWLIREIDADRNFKFSDRQISEGVTKEIWAKDITRQVGETGGFKAKNGLKGHFRLQGFGGVSKLYLEGGINIAGNFKPFKTSQGVLQIGSRLLKTDFQDLPFSAQTGTQRNVPLVMDQFLYRWRPVKGKMYGKLKSAYPFQYEWTDDFKKQRLTRGDVKAKILSDAPITEKISTTAKAVAKNPLKAAKYIGKRLPGVGGKAVALGATVYGLGSALMPEDGYSLSNSK